MQTVKKYWEDAYVFEFEGKIAEIVQDEKQVGIVFEETYFYPEGGGQPSDKGMIAAFPIVDVQEVGEKIVHYIPSTETSRSYFSTGMSVPCEIDRDYRINNMRLHTTCHLLFGAAHKLFGEVGYAGFNIGKVGNLYLETPRQIRSDDLREISRLANDVVVDDRQVSSAFVRSDEARAMKNLSYNLELPTGLVRLIEVDGWDIAACSGTHISRTVELGPIKVIAREIHKKNVTRIDYAVGKLAVEEMAKDDKSLSETAEFLNTSKDQTPVLVRKLSGEYQSAQKELRQMRERLMEYRVNELQSGGGEIIAGVRVIIDKVDYLDGNSIKLMVQKLLNGVSKTVVAMIGGSDILSIAAGTSSDLNLMISASIVALAKKYGGGGGGKPTFVSAGGIQCPGEQLMTEVKDLIRQEILNR